MSQKFSIFMIMAVDLPQRWLSYDLWVKKWIVTFMQNVINVSTVPSAIRCETVRYIIALYNNVNVISSV